MKFPFRILFGLGFLIILFGSVSALEEDEGQNAADIVPRIVAPEAIEVGKKVIFDASLSTYPADEDIQVRWDLGDGNTTSEFPEIVHTYTKTGASRVRLTLTKKGEEFTAEREIFVFDTRAVLFTSEQILEQNSEIVEEAKANGVFLKTITIEEDSSAVIMEERFLQKMQQERTAITNADIMIFWAPSSLEIRAFTRYWQGLEEQRRFPLTGKLFVRITDGGISVAEATLQQIFEILKPDFFLLTRPEGISPIFQEKDFNSIAGTLGKRGIEFTVINEESRPSSVRLLSRIVGGFMFQGIPASTIFLVLSFPFIAFLVAFFHQVIGLSIYGVFLPIMLALSFQVLPLGFALLVLFVILALSLFLRIFFQRMDILYIPRAALKLSIIALSFLTLIWIALKVGSSFSITLAIFPMLVMTNLSEKFLSAQSEEGRIGALFGALETILVAIVAFFLVNFSFFKELLLSFPELIVLPILGTLFLGRFTGLRLTEYIRFRSLLKEGIEE